ncbi:aminoacyl-tRNA hydrolase [Candidatus Saccharibacteria bacterium]|nr:aminoacyl-tRNA hydrolase [Candidatus Saccharibacteria bacterium]
MKIIAAFGNPGSRYHFTRHNFGFLALDFYAKIHHLEWKDSKKHQVKYIRQDDVLLVKPQTFYNDVGQSLASLRSYYKLQPADFLIICDDFMLDFGQIRFRERGSAGGNNGLKSAIAQLGSTDFPRLRLGTGNDALRAKLGDTDFVLSKFTPEEHAQLPQILKKIADFVENY